MHVEPTTLTDEEIARRVQSGDIDAFGTVVDRYEERLRRYGKKFIARDEDIEDVVQDVFMSVYQNIKEFNGSLRFSPWIYRIAHNAFVNTLRKSGRVTYSPDFDTVVAHHVYEDPAENERELRDMRAMIDRGLAVLPPHYREVLLLYYYENMSYKDIADIVRVPVGTVSIRLKRAKEALKEKIAHTL